MRYNACVNKVMPGSVRRKVRPKAKRYRGMLSSLVAGLATLLACSSGTEPTDPQPLVVDFDGLAPHTAGSPANRGCTYSEDGVTLVNLNCGGGGAFNSIHPGNFRYSASVSFYNNVQLGVTRVTLTSGGSFALVSIDLDGLNGSATFVPPGGNFPYPQPALFTFIGTLPDGSTVTESFATDHQFPNRQTFAFSGLFDRVTQVVWAQDNGYPRPSQQFDNIVLIPLP